MEKCKETVVDAKCTIIVVISLLCHCQLAQIFFDILSMSCCSLMMCTRDGIFLQANVSNVVGAYLFGFRVLTIIEKFQVTNRCNEKLNETNGACLVGQTTD